MALIFSHYFYSIWLFLSTYFSFSNSYQAVTGGLGALSLDAKFFKQGGYAAMFQVMAEITVVFTAG
ncbi:hypothetical protein [Dehalococcoides mccartyi]|uniref:hypothetical protein n=1 Tax=Dehalococcoides mccartyi TaxID=61435 RepID=UPI001F3AACB0|nr:hypothetical protein [Dehalococcoides mccartyi]